MVTITVGSKDEMSALKNAIDMSVDIQYDTLLDDYPHNRDTLIKMVRSQGGVDMRDFTKNVSDSVDRLIVLSSMQSTVQSAITRGSCTLRIPNSNETQILREVIGLALDIGDDSLLDDLHTGEYSIEKFAGHDDDEVRNMLQESRAMFYSRITNHITLNKIKAQLG